MLISEWTRLSRSTTNFWILALEEKREPGLTMMKQQEGCFGTTPHGEHVSSVCRAKFTLQNVAFITCMMKNVKVGFEGEGLEHGEQGEGGKSLSFDIHSNARRTHTSIEKLAKQGWELSGGLSTLKIASLNGRESKRKLFKRAVV